MATQYRFASNVCIPEHNVVLTVFKNIQREVNRFLDDAGRPLLTIDGKLGSRTVDGINFATANTPLPTISSCKQVADDPATFYNGLRAIADNRELALVMDPMNIVRTFVSPQPRVEPSGRVVYPSAATAGIGGVPYWALALAGVGGLYYAKKKGLI